MPGTEDSRQTCLFCRIAAGELEAEIVYENDRLLAFRDISPKAPVHVLLIPRIHIPTVDDLGEEHRDLLADLFLAASRIARDQGVDEGGYRLVVNCREGAGQSVFHLHMHLLGGRPFQWPPG